MNQKGFTLIEIVIAVGVFAVLTALAYGGLSQVLNQSRATTEISQKLQQLQYVFSFMQQDFMQMLPREIRDEYGNRQPAIETPVDESSLLRFTRGGWPNPAEQTRSSYQRVAYVLEEDQLQRHYWFELDRPPSAEPIVMELLEDIEEVKFRFLDNDKEWEEEWPPTGTVTPSTTTPLPVAIEINIETKRWGLITRVFSLVEQPKTLPAIGAPTASTTGSSTGGTTSSTSSSTGASSGSSSQNQDEDSNTGDTTNQESAP